MSGASSETRKAVCRALAKVVKGSPVATGIDPKAFFMMIATNFHVFYRGGKVQLAPLWDALWTRCPPEVLPGLFLKFEQALRELNMYADLPPILIGLSAQDRETHLARFQGYELNTTWDDPTGITPLIEIEQINAGPLPELSSQDIKPLIPDDLRRRVSQAVVAAIRSAPVGKLVEPAQVAYMIDTNFDALCDGARFNFDPVYRALKELGAVTDSDVYFVVVKLQDAFVPMMLELDLPPLEVGNEEAAEIAQRARAKPNPSMGGISGEFKIPNLVTPGRGTSRDQLPKVEDQAQPRTTSETKKETRLRELGLLGFSPKVWKAIRISALVVVFASVGVYGFFNRPNRELDLDQFATVFPLKKAEIVDGYFAAQLDEVRWSKMRYAEREKAVLALEAFLKAEDLMSNTQIRNSKNMLVVSQSGPGITASPALMKLNLPEGDTSAPHEKPPRRDTSATN